MAVAITRRVTALRALVEVTTYEGLAVSKREGKEFVILEGDMPQNVLAFLTEKACANVGPEVLPGEPSV